MSQKSNYKVLGILVTVVVLIASATILTRVKTHHPVAKNVQQTRIMSST